jgi:hypothetical protein
MTTNLWNSLLLWIAATVSLSGLTCLNAGCAATLNDSKFSIRSIERKSGDGIGVTVEQPLWWLSVSTKGTKGVFVDASWDGVAIVKAGIEKTGELVRAFIGMLGFPTVPLPG